MICMHDCVTRRVHRRVKSAGQRHQTSIKKEISTECCEVFASQPSISHEVESAAHFSFVCFDLTRE